MNTRILVKVVIGLALIGLVRIPAYCLAQSSSPEDVVLRLAEAYERADDEAFYRLCEREWKDRVPLEWVRELNQRWRKNIKQLPPFPVDRDKTKVTILTDTTATVEVTSQESLGRKGGRRRQVTYALTKEGGKWRITNPYGHAIPIWWGEHSDEEKAVEAVMTQFATALMARDYEKMYELSQFTSGNPISLEEHKEKAKKRFQITEYYSLEDVMMLAKPKIADEGFGEEKDKSRRAYTKIICRARGSEPGGVPFFKFYGVTLEKTANGWRILER